MTLLELLQEILGKDNILENENLSRHTSLKIGGPARFFVKADNEEKLIKLISCLDKENIKYYIWGNGTNILAQDSGYDGVIIKLSGEFDSINVSKDEKEITAGAAVLLSSLSKKALEKGMTGLEFASGIPGTLGGALVMNAGAYGGEIKQLVKSVKALEKIDGNYRITFYSNEQMHFEYRHSIANEKSIIFLSAELTLAKADRGIIKATMDEMNKSRREKQPLEYPSAGSTFKRPEGYFAGKLISDAGLKAYSVGDASVSEKHAGFCINKGNASSVDFQQLMKDVSDKVYSLYGVKLEPEVIILK